MQVFQTREAWVPADGLELEPNALGVAKSEANQLVVAGPGAGKTELLAQRACFLLQTNTCPYPKRILAISFKRDAAGNLKERVSKRIDKTFSYRFTSLTFDAFAKSLVDRFRNALPEEYRPSLGYDVFPNPMVKEVLSVFKQIDPRADTNSYPGKRRLIGLLTRENYPLDPNSLEGKVLSKLLKEREKSILTFPIISRLALLLISTNPLIKSFLRQTYSHVFLDEFQDTTHLQYELLTEIFLGSETILTAVGDSKQRIMLWAGAMQGIFETYKDQFRAPEAPLFMNFRSAPRLVSLQNHLVSVLMGGTAESTPRPDRKEEEGIAEFWVFEDFEQEGEIVAREIAKMIGEGSIPAREICLLFKQQPDLYSKNIQEELTKIGLHSRIENDFQDLLNEPIIQFLLNLLYAALLPKSYEEKDHILEQYLQVYRVSEDERALEVEKELLTKLQNFRKLFTESTEWIEIRSILEQEIESISYETFRSLYQQYNDQTYFESLLTTFYGVMEQYFEEGRGLLSATDKFRGLNCIPIMTIHKSKGLEFEVVFFIGFEDQNFWSFNRQQEEDTCSFFVALSRAKNAVYFTFSKERINNFGTRERRSNSTISPLWKALNSSGIVVGKKERQ